MRQSFSAATAASADELFDVVSDLSTYPHWLDLVSEVEATDESETFLVTLRARVGPFSRSKRLRMTRVIHHRARPGDRSMVRFERQEIDGRDHADWVLAAEVATLDRGAEMAGETMASHVELDLAYEGPLWSGLLDGVLAAAAERAAGKLQAYVRR